jgi:mRNA interferase YafQ
MTKVKLSDSQFNKYIKYLSLLSNGKKLPKEANNHNLKGEWSGFEEFHLGGDMVMIYHFINGDLELIRVGTHNQVFKKY